MDQNVFRLDVLIPFDMIIDPEMGLMKLIEFEFRDELFNLSALGTDDLTKLYLSERDLRNPLSILLNRDKISIDMMIDMHQQFFDKYYQQILNLSPRTDLFRLLMIADTNEALNFTVVCKDEQQEKLFKEREGKAHRIVIGDIFDEELMSTHDSFYIKYIEDLEGHEVHGKNIYIGDYFFNKLIVNGKMIPNITPETMEHMMDNTFKFVTLFAPNKERLEYIYQQKINFNESEEEEEA
ncbi:MAG: hypothetical protein PHC62_00350 [Candidatus Izemoplasmatales bacterium]|nr:hypothetical protein [Candidatus Izemoplasmatales bacterium]